MVKLLIKLFVPKGQPTDGAVRSACGKLSGITGIILNLLLVAGKLAAGFIAGSVAVIGDALNNLSDAASSIVMLAGFKLSARKPDKEHPYGHGRGEYVAGLIVSCLIIFMAFELGRSSVEGIISPDQTQFSWLVAGILAAGILVKLWLFYFNRKLARMIDSPTLSATATDSLSDVVATAVALVAAICGQYTTFPLDGVAGLIVALFILKAGVDSFRTTLSPLLGKPMSRELAQKIDDLALEHENILGVHDLIYHDYGPGRAVVSFHVEVPADSDLKTIHSMIDHIEREIAEKFDIEAVIHADPTCSGDSCGEVKELAESAAKSVHPDATIHDLQIESSAEGRKIYFDMVIPFGLKMSDDAAASAAEKYMAERGECAVVRIDHPMIEN